MSINYFILHLFSFIINLLSIYYIYIIIAIYLQFFILNLSNNYLYSLTIIQLLIIL